MKYLKKLLFRFIFLILIIFTILIIFENILFHFKTKWQNEDIKIVTLNINKLQNSIWNDGIEIIKYKDEGKLPSKGNHKRILIIGDSFVWGHGYSNLNHVWWRQLARILYENGYYDVDVVAAGRCGYNTQQELAILENQEIMEEIDPDLIIIGFVSNDFEISNDYGEKILPIYDAHDALFNSKNDFIKLVKKIFPSIYANLGSRIINKYETVDVVRKNGYAYNYTAWLNTLIEEPYITMYEQKALKPLKNIINELDIPVFMYPIENYPYMSKQHEIAMQEFEKYDIPYYNAMNDYVKKYEGSDLNSLEWRINPANSHPAVKSTLFYAEWLYNKLIEDYSNIIGNKYEVNELPLEINDWTPYMLKPTLVDENVYELTYPAKKEENAFLNLPVNEDYIKLNLKFAINIKSIEITGDNIESIKLWTNSVNKELGYDDQVMKSLGKKKNKFIWNLNDNDLITSINISAIIKKGKSEKLKIKFTY